MTHKRWIYAALGAAALVLALGWAFAPRPLAVETALATLGRFEASVDEEGKTRLSQRYLVAAPLAGQLARITLKEGDAVSPGETLAVLTPMLSTLLDERSRRELLAREEAAAAGLNRAVIRIGRAQVALEQAQLELKRAEQLAQQGFVAPVKLDADRLAARAAEQELQAAGAERHIAQHELQQARASLGATRQASAGGQSGSFLLRAPVAGQVMRVLQSSEGAVAMGTPLLELGDTSQLEVVAELLTADALAIKPASLVFIERWGGPTSLEGRVLRVEPAAFTKVSALGVEEQRVRVLISITSPRALWQALGDGYRVGVRIVTLTQDRAVLVPVSAVFPLPSPLAQAAPASAAADEGSGSAAGAGLGAGIVATGAAAAAAHAVFVLDGGRARQTAVRVLARNAGMAWIGEGLAPGTPVVVYPPAILRDGDRVQPR
jgi:HlyD family secretion protein